MANWYVDSNAAGSPTDGLTWDTAFHTLAEAAAVDNAGDIIWVASDHSESTAGAVSLSWAGTKASPTRVISADKTSGEPPSTVQSGAAVSTTGASNITNSLSTGGSLYVYGIIYTAGNSTSSADLFLASATSGSFLFESCDFILGGNNAGSDLFLSSSANALVEMKDCRFRVSNADSQLTISFASRVNIQGGSWLSGGTTPTTLLAAAANMVELNVDGFDFSNLGSSFDFVNSATEGHRLSVRDCKLPSGWSGNLTGTTPPPGFWGQLVNCSGSDINYALTKEGHTGSIIHETTLVKSGGASDGTTSISWEMTTNADAEWSHQTLDSPEMMRWNETVGSPIVVTVDILHDGSQGGSPSEPLTDRDIWLELQYLGTDGVPLGNFKDDAASTYTTTAVVQELSSASWTTTGMSNPVAQKLVVLIRPETVGFIVGKVRVAKASYTVYIDPQLQVEA